VKGIIAESSRQEFALRELGAPMKVMRVLKDVMCSTGSPLPSKEERDDNLKPSGTGAFQISTASG